MMEMSFFALGLNYQTAPVEVREHFELSDNAVRELYRTTKLGRGGEWILLSTCNRTEAYVYGAPSDAIDIQKAIEAHCGEWPSENTFVYQQEDALQHIFEVASGLRSQILGDSQILSQVKTAYRLSHECQSVGPRLHRLMHATFGAAKRVISTTALGAGGPSIARSAVTTLRERMIADQRSLEDLSVLVLGCGHMGLRVVKELSNQPPATCCVTNRTEERARKVAAKFGMMATPWEARHQHMAESDVVIVATGSSDFVVRASDFEPFSKETPTIVVDISVPRNVDSALDDHEGFEVLNIDELSRANGHHTTVKRRDVDKARAICAQAVQEAIGWDKEREMLEPAARALRATFESIRRREVERNIHRFAVEDHEHVDRLTRSIMQKLIAIPMIRLKEMASGDGDLVQRLELLNALFDKGDCEELTSER